MRHAMSYHKDMRNETTPAAIALLKLLSPATRKRLKAAIAAGEAAKINAVRLTDGKDVRLSPGEIRYGRPTNGHTMRTQLLKLFPEPGLVPYEVVFVSKSFSAVRRRPWRSPTSLAQPVTSKCALMVVWLEEFARMTRVGTSLFAASPGQRSPRSAKSRHPWKELS